MKHTRLSIAIACLAFSPLLSHAANSVQLKVTGRIMPTSCAISMPSGSTVDYGSTPANNLSKDTFTKLDDGKTPRFALQVACDAPTLFSIKSTDERAGTAINVNSAAFGLGKTKNDEKIGGYVMLMSSPKADGKLVSSVFIDKASNAAAGRTTVFTPGQEVGFAAFSSATELLAIKDLLLDVAMDTSINKANDLTLTDTITIDGLATFELIYL